MIWTLLVSLLISVSSSNASFGNTNRCNDGTFENECNYSVGRNGINVALANDDVLSGSLISATLTVPDSISSLSVSDSSEDLLVSLVNNEDGTYSSNIQTDGDAGEYFVTLSSSNSVSIDCDPSEITSLYIYSDGINDCVSYCSIDEAKAKYFTNHVATEEELILLGKEEVPDNFSPSMTRYSAEAHYAEVAYGGDDITTDWVVSSGNFSNKIKVEGSVTWYDENEISHPLKNVYAVLWDDDFFWDEYCDSAYTDDDGNFSFEIDNQTFLGLGGRDLFVNLYSISEAASVHGFWWGTYIYCTPKFDNVHNNSKIVYDIKIHPGASDRANAFEICQAEIIPHDYIEEMNGTTLPTVSIYYPAFNGDGCYYTSISNYIAVGRKYYRDWDCLNHEYGHYINRKLNLCDYSVGGEHNINEDLIDTHGKSNGLKLAMSEGLATYLGTAAQMYYANDYVGYPRVGDEAYNAINNVNANFNQYHYGCSLSESGEGNEFCVTSVLIKLLDDVTRANDNVGLGHETMWTAIATSCHSNISELICTILSQNESQRSAIGKILELEGFSPTPSSYQNSSLSVESTNSCWTFSWTKNGFVSGQPNKFTLTFEGASGDSYSIENIVATSITLNTSQINSVLALSGSTIKWFVTSYNIDSPITGGYVTSDSLSLKPIAAELSLNASTSATLVATKTKWFKFTAPYTGTYHFESTSDLDLYGELFPNFVADNTYPNRLDYNDDGGNNHNFLITTSLSSGQTIYLRVRGFAYLETIFGTFSVTITADHVHSYSDHFAFYSSEKHRACCSCGDFVLLSHAIQAGSTYTHNGHAYANCIDCGALIDLGTTIVIVGPSANQNLMVTDNGSYILPNGIYVIMEEDIVAYLDGTLEFHDSGSQSF